MDTFLAEHGRVRLSIELVPSSCWYSNVRTVLTRWGTGIASAAKVYEAAGRRCEVCGGARGGVHPVECHEAWEYDDVGHVQRLARMTALCPACHEVKTSAGLESWAEDGRLGRIPRPVNGGDPHMLGDLIASRVGEGSGNERHQWRWRPAERSADGFIFNTLIDQMVGNANAGR